MTRHNLNRVLLLALVVAAGGCGRQSGAQATDRISRWGDDILAGGGGLVIGDTVPGDVIAAGGSIAFSGSTGGDYLGAGGEQQISGEVGGSVRAAGGDVVLGAQVGRNVTLAGGHVEIRPGAVIGRNAYLAGGEVEVAGEVNGFLDARGREVTITGHVGGDARVRARSLRIGPGARIEGNLDHNVAPEHVTIDPAAQMASGVIAGPPESRAFDWILRIIWHLGFLAAGAVAVALFPRFAESAVQALKRRPWAALGFGVLWLIAIPLAAGVIAITVIGLPLALIVLTLFAISLYLGRAVIALWLGRRIVGARAGNQRTGVVLSFLLGALILLVLGIIPWVGGLVTLIATLVGLGAAALLIRRRSVEPAGT